jgi:hypothetical protein
VTIDAEPGPMEPGPEELKRPGNADKKLKILVCCLLGVFAVLAAYGLVTTGVGPSGNASASGTSLPADTQPAAASTSAASPSPASLSAASPIAAAPAPSHRVASPNPVARPAPRLLAVTAIAAFGPEGILDGDHPEIASMAVDDGTQPWDSSWYLSPEFGNLQAGTGLLLDMGKSVTVSSVRLILGGQVGADVQVRVGDTAALAELPTVATATDVGGTVRLPTTIRANGRYVLIWFTALPPIGQGKYQVSVYDATVDGTAGT